MKENVSALLDGALDEMASSRMLESLKRDGGLRRDWEKYCLIGDVLRDEEVLSSDFTMKVMQSLADEPTVLAPVHNDVGEAWVRHLMPIAASVMGVAAVGWVAMVLNGSGQDSMRMAGAKVPVIAAASPAKSADAPLAVTASAANATGAETSEREYLFAHQAMAPSAAMPGVALYVRTVSDSRSAAE